MRLTSDLILQSPALLNCLGDRTLILRNLSIPAIENLAVARDSFDAIDLSGNLIPTLGDTFPPFPRLTTLFLGANRITSITNGLAQSLPNLTTLVLTANRLATLDELNLAELAKLTKLEVLCIRDNPVADLPGSRDKIVGALPSLKVLDFIKVTRRAEQANGKENKKKRKRKADEHVSQQAKRRSTLPSYEFQPENTTDRKSSEKKKPIALTEEMSAKLRQLIADAPSVEVLARIQKAVREGNVAQLFT